jgi:hypothetical protein
MASSGPTPRTWKAVTARRNSAVVKRLYIALINALTPQAKRQVERANQTSQDRLIKEMQLRGMSSMEAAQAFLPSFMLR